MRPRPVPSATAVAAVLVLASFALGCAAAPRPAAPSAAAPELMPDLELRALLLLLADRRSYEPLTANQAMNGPPELRRELAVALGRIGAVEGLEQIHALLFDKEVAVRRAATFAAGEIGRRDSARALLLAVTNEDRETGTLAVESLGKIGVAVAEVEKVLLPLPEAEREARLLPYLFRFHEPALVTIATRGLASSDPELHARSAYALAREPYPEARPQLRSLLADPDPWVRGVAARGLGIVGEAQDIAALRPLLDDPEAGPIVQALRAGRRLVEGGKQAAPDAWRGRLAELAADPRPGVALTAMEAATAWLLDPTLGDLLAARARSGEGRYREVALLALATGHDPRAAELAGAAATSPDPALRSRVADATAFLSATAARPIQDRLAADPDGGVRAAVLAARLAGDAAAAAPHLVAALGDPDPIVRASALDALSEAPRATVPFETLLAATHGRERGLLDAAVALPPALRARAEAEPKEKGAIVAALEQMARAAEPLVRRRAGEALTALGGNAPPVGPFTTGSDVTEYRDLVVRTREPRTVEVVTVRGTARIRLACPEAPQTCVNFLHLAGNGYFDGLRFHRVVPDFVVQDGDPRGDGSGGPGYEIRDEINGLRYGRGAVGMALSGPDTGGSQWFVTLTAQPHLDGGYTTFGEVVSGMEVFDTIVQGDRIETIREVE